MHSIDAKLAKRQKDQLGLVTPKQAHGDHISRAALARRRKAGALEVVAGPVLTAGAPASHDQCVLAHVLAAGETAFASHETAASLWEIPLPGPAALEITVTLERLPRTRGVRFHRSGMLDLHDVVEHNSIPVSSPALTIVQLSSRFDIRQLGRMADDAVRRGLTTLAEIRVTSERLKKAPGRSPKKIAQMLDRRLPGGDVRESELEDFVFDALRRFALPIPEMQYPVTINGKKRRIDFFYEEAKVALEPKGFDFRRFRTAFDNDAMRENDLVLSDLRVLTFTAAFTDWQIACQVAHALKLPQPPKQPPLTFEDWKRLR